MTEQLPPLAERMRPLILDQFVGQEHLLGIGKPFRAMLEKKSLTSMILWGPPGCGKTTLARLLARAMEAEFIQISAVSSGVKEVRSVIETAARHKTEQRSTILFIDEIHRFNKSQQDALLHSVEQGILILIGATTENPSFEIIPPLRSRCRTYLLNPLTIENLQAILKTALQNDVELSKKKISFEDEESLIAFSGGDARLLLNGLEVCCTLAEKNGEVIITEEILSEAFQRSFAKYDKGGEEHYNVISAFIKSVRGSDPDAAIYWLARMLEGGEDPLFIARRLIVLASEDIGNAEPNALLLANTCFQSVHSIGMPEARIILSQTTAYLAYCPKSNASYLAIEKALEDTRNLPPYAVPLHLRNPVTSLMKNMKYGKGYKYAHDFEAHFVEQQFLPTELTDKQYYFPSEMGKEKSIKERLRSLWKKRTS